MDRNGKIMIFLVVILSILFSITCVFFFHEVFSKRQKTGADGQTPTAPSADLTPALPEDLLPKNLYVGRKAPEAVFVSSAGESVLLMDIAQNAENGVVVSFGEPMCGALCEQMTASCGFSHVVVGSADYSDATALIVSDPDNAVYKSWGIQALPSVVVISSLGDVLEYHTGKISIGEMKGLLRRARDGRSSVSIAFIENSMSDGNGGFATNTSPHGSSPYGRDVLSESQGLIMLYALAADNRALFDKTWQFTRSNLLKNGIAAWYVRSDGAQADVNALLDDLRIWYALYQAGSQWNDAYAQDAESMLAGIKENCLDDKNRLVDYTDLNNGTRAGTISLQYLDLSILKLMAEADHDFEDIRQKAENILLDGRISDEFPLYYKNYDYSSRAYDQGNLNTAEALYTLWNLSKAGLLQEDSLNWLRNNVEKGTLAARYRKNGSPVSGYEYHSTAVYGLAALIAKEMNDDSLFEMAVRRMERQFVLDEKDSCYGAYTQKGAVIYSFDQMIPLLVNAYVDRITGDGKSEG